MFYLFIFYILFYLFIYLLFFFLKNFIFLMKKTPKKDTNLIMREKKNTKSGGWKSRARGFFYNFSDSETPPPPLLRQCYLLFCLYSGSVAVCSVPTRLFIFHTVLVIYIWANFSYNYIFFQGFFLKRPAPWTMYYTRLCCLCWILPVSMIWWNSVFKSLALTMRRWVDGRRYLFLVYFLFS